MHSKTPMKNFQTSNWELSQMISGGDWGISLSLLFVLIFCSSDFISLSLSLLHTRTHAQTFSPSQFIPVSMSLYCFLCVPLCLSHTLCLSVSLSLSLSLTHTHTPTHTISPPLPPSHSHTLTPPHTQFLPYSHRSGATLESVLVEAFAVAREAAWRVLELRHFDVQVWVMYSTVRYNFFIFVIGFITVSSQVHICYLLTLL